MLLPVSLESVLSDKALTISGKGGLSTEKASKNMDIDQFLEELLAQIQVLTGEGAEIALPDEHGEILPLLDLEGNSLPLDELTGERLQALVLQSGNDPAALMQALAALKREMKDPYLMQTLDDLSRIKASNQQALELKLHDRLAMQLVQESARETDGAKLVDLLNGFEPDAFAELNPDRRMNFDINRLNQLLSAAGDTANGLKQAITNAARDTAMPVQNLNAMIQTGTPARSDQATAVLTLQPQVFKADWTQAFNSSIVLLARDHMQSARLNINPPELGPIEVRLSVQNDQTSIQFVSHHAATRDVIEDAFPRLREMMASNGINLGDVNVSEHSASDRQQAQADFQTRTLNTDEPVETTEVVMALRNTSSLVDHYI